MKRRAFLGLTGGLGVSFVVGGCLPVIPKRPDPTVKAASGWIRYDRGRYLLTLPRAEIGQNIATAMKQVACDELGVDWDMIDVETHATRRLDLVRATVGSESIEHFMLPLAHACATLRDALDSGQISGILTVEERPISELKIFSRQTRFVGKKADLVDGRNIVTGKSLYASDIRLPAMVYGRVLRAPASPEIPSKPISWDEKSTRNVAGYIALVHDKRLIQGNSRGLGIVAATPGGLERMEEALNVRWQVEGSLEQEDIDRLLDIDARLSAGDLSHQLVDDNVAADEEWDIDLRFEIPMAAHAAMEPRAAVAAFSDAKLKMWVGSQDAFYVRDVLADLFDLDSDDVNVQNMRVGGAFGGKTICLVEREAAVLAYHTKLPLKVQWTRVQEFRYGFHRSPSSHRIRARLENGQLTDWWHSFASGHIIFTNAAMPPWMQQLTDFVSDKGVARGALPSYRMARQRIEHDQVRLPVLTGPWRGLGAGPNATVIECMIDECAYLAGRSPLEFRLSHIDDPRLAHVLRKVAKNAGPAGYGRGYACGIYKGKSYAAVAADVSVAGDGQVQVDQLYCVHDCGLVINPDQVRAQCEGNLVWGIGLALSDNLQVADGGIDATTFADFPVPRFEDIPALEIELVSSDKTSTGAGETAIVAASAAILNAVRDATGKRVTRLPVRPEDLLG